VSKILKRPMFRRGGPANDGIMTGLVNRTKHADNPFVTGIGKRTDVLAPEFETILDKYTPKTKLPIGELGLNLASGMSFTDALRDPYKRFTTADDAREAAVKTGAAKLALGQAMKEAQPSKQSILAAEKKAKFLLPENASAAEIRAKTAEIIQAEMTGKTFSDTANFRRAYEFNKNQEGKAYKAYNLTVFEEIISPKLRSTGETPKGKIKKNKDGSYKTERKTPGVYVDTEDGVVIEITNELTIKKRPELTALLKK